MKKLKLLLIVVFLLSGGFTMQQISAQEKSKAEKEKEQKMLQAIDEQKKAMTIQKKAVTEAEAAMTIQKRAVTEAEAAIEVQKAVNEDLMKDIQVQVESAGRAGDAVRIYNQRNRPFQYGEPFVFTPGVESFFGHSGGDTERTTWDFSKSIKENTFARDYTFDVEKTVNTVVMSVMGDCKAGEIRIKILMPNGKNYSDIVIDEFGNLNWRKSFTISETENQDKAGEWKFQISSTKATGYFKISLQTY